MADYVVVEQEYEDTIVGTGRTLHRPRRFRRLPARILRAFGGLSGGSQSRTIHCCSKGLKGDFRGPIIDEAGRRQHSPSALCILPLRSYDRISVFCIFASFLSRFQNHPFQSRARCLRGRRCASHPRARGSKLVHGKESGLEDGATWSLVLTGGNLPMIASISQLLLP